MEITYELGQYTSSDRDVEVTYTRDTDGFIFKRRVNIPHLEDGSIDENYFQDILQGQLSGVIHKIRVGAIMFTDPNAVGITST